MRRPGSAAIVLLLGCSSAPPAKPVPPAVTTSAATAASVAAAPAPSPEPCADGDLLECASRIANKKLDDNGSGWLDLSLAWSRVGDIDRAHAIIMDRLDRMRASVALSVMVREGLKHGNKAKELLEKVDAKIEQLVSKPYELRSALTLGGLVAARAVVKPEAFVDLPRGVWSDFDFEMAEDMIHRGPTKYFYLAISAEGQRLQGNRDKAALFLAVAHLNAQKKMGLHRSIDLERVASEYAELGIDGGVRDVCKTAERPYDCAPMILAMAEAHRKEPAKAKKLVAEAGAILLAEPQGGNAVALSKAMTLAVKFGDAELADKLVSSGAFGSQDPHNLAHIACLSQAPPDKKTQWMNQARALAEAEKDEEDRVRKHLQIADGCGEGGDEAQGIRLALAQRDHVGTGRNRERLAGMLAEWGAVEGWDLLSSLEGDLRERALELYAAARAERDDILGALRAAAAAKTAGTRVAALAAAGEAQRRAKRALTSQEKAVLVTLTTN